MRKLYRKFVCGCVAIFCFSSGAQGVVPYLFLDSFENRGYPPKVSYVKPETDSAAARFLTQATFGPTFESIQELRQLGYEAWFEKQKNMPIIKQLDELDRRMVGLSEQELSKLHYDNQLEIWFNQAQNGEEQLRHRVAFALSQLFVISNKSTATNKVAGLASYYDMLMEQSLGNYRELLEKVTLHPMMGRYLSMWKNRRPGEGKANTRARIDLKDDSSPDENFAREVMQLFSIGLDMLNEDGSKKKTVAGKTIPTYDLDTVIGFSHVFTGWNWGSCKDAEPNPFANYPRQPPFVSIHWNYCPEIDDKPDGGKQPGAIAQRYRLPMKPWGGADFPGAYYAKEGTKQLLKYPGSKLVNGILPAGGSILGDMKEALDNIFEHPNVPPFISRHLIQHLTTANPTPEYIARVSKVFKDNGSGVRGDLYAVVKAILMDEEARDATKAPGNFGKIREPIIRIIGLYRAFHAKSRKGGFYQPWIRNYTRQMVMDSPTVFNYYLPDYTLPGLELKSPVFQIMTDSQIGQVGHYLGAKIYSHSHLGTLRPNQTRERITDETIQLNYAELLPYVDSPEQLVEKLNLLLTYGSMPGWMKKNLVKMMEVGDEEHGDDYGYYLQRRPNWTQEKIDTTKRFRISNTIWLIVMSPTYIIEGH